MSRLRAGREAAILVAAAACSFSEAQVELWEYNYWLFLTFLLHKVSQLRKFVELSFTVTA